MPLPDSFLQELKEKNDIESVVASYVNLKRRGRNLIGLCPFHNEKTPSFTLYPENGSFYCFGCGTGGDVIRFVMLAENLDYIEAVRHLAQRAGMSMPEQGYDDGLSRLRGRILEINRESARFFYATLLSDAGRSGLDYFRSRGLGDRTIRHFGLGFAPASWRALYDHLHAKGFSDAELLQARVVNQGRGERLYDSFRGRMMFPILDLRGNVVAFGGRKAPDAEGPKYINTADTPVFKKSHTMYALNFAKASCAEQVVLCEGYMDVIALHQAGITNAVAPLGTAFTKEQARLLARYTKEVAITLDADEAGKKATDRAIEICSDTGLKVRVVRIPDGKDPDEFLRAHPEDGASRFRALLDGAGNDVEYRLFELSRQVDLSTADGVVKFLDGAARVLGSLDSAIERDVYAGRLAEQYKVSKSAILQQAETHAKRMGAKRDRQSVRAMTAPERADPVNPERRRYPRAANAEEGLLAVLLRNPDFYEQVAKRIQPEQFVTSFHRRLFEKIGQRVREGHLVDITLLGAECTDAELGRIVEIMTKGENRANTIEECQRCIDVILEERAKLELTPEDMSVEQLSEYIEKMREKKLGGVQHDG